VTFPYFQEVNRQENKMKPIHYSLIFSSALMGMTFTGCQKAPVVDENQDPKVAKLTIPEGFMVEHLYSPAEAEQGSWVGMTFDDQGRMIASDQYGALYRMALPAIGSGDSITQVEKLMVGDSAAGSKLEMGYAQGLLYAFNSLYVMVNHNINDEFDKGTGLYRLQDSDGDDQFDQITLLKSFEGWPGEHGPHSMVVAPDSQSIYVVVGNHIDVPEMDAYRLPNTWNEDNIFPLIKDPRGHANSRTAPGGWIAKINPEGSHWELISAGFRNPYDIAFNEVGDLFTYDSDMEWDFGMPWYRPTRICHVTSGSEFGWRTGNQKWSPSWPDNLPALLNIGQGSPTNVMFGTQANFPEKYRKALYAFDWSFGIIYAVFPEPKGGSYTATAEAFLSGSPLPLTDGEIGPDGAMYFMTGGRRLESDVYRVYYGEPIKNKKVREPKIPEEGLLRRELEALHFTNSAVEDEEKMALIVKNLGHRDRFVQYAARVALEHQPADQWVQLVVDTKSDHSPSAAIQGLMACARQDSNVYSREAFWNRLVSLPFDKLSLVDQINWLRALEVQLYRQGLPTAEWISTIGQELMLHFPSGDNEIDRLLAKILIFLGVDGAIENILKELPVAADDPGYQKTFTSSSDLILRNPQYGLDIAEMLANVPPAQQSYLATVLGGAKIGWTPETWEAYFSWINEAFQYKGGRSYVGFIDRARKMVLATVPKEDSTYYDEMSGSELLSESGNELRRADIQPEGPWRNWKLEVADSVVADLHGRNLEVGKAMYAAVLCKSCHAIKGEGGMIGPDLTQLGTRFSTTDMLEAILEPNKVISDQYSSTIFTLEDGSSVVGKLVNEDNRNYYISQNPFAPDEVKEIRKRSVADVKVSEVSIMMPNLINPLNEEELKDLMAYLMSGGEENHPVYQK
jgi:putative heme-binding domain-containing protein